MVVAQGLSNCVSQPLENRLNSCGTQTYLLHDMWDLPGSGIKRVSLAFAGRFLTSKPPGKPLNPFFCSLIITTSKLPSEFPNLSPHCLHSGSQHQQLLSQLLQKLSNSSISSLILFYDFHNKAIE